LLNITLSLRAKQVFIAALGVLSLTACTTAKLEARLEANPQCKDVVNPKTGALMPCPGSDKAFYRSVGLEAAKPQSSAAAAPAPIEETTTQVTKASSAVNSAVTASSKPSTPTPTTTDCKPQLHKKTGSMLPCPAPD
jgi:hypothetical protein